MVSRRLSRLTLLTAVLAPFAVSAASSAAHASADQTDCANANGSGLAEVVEQVAHLSAPFRKVYFDASKFEQDTLGSHLALLQSSLDAAMAPAKKSGWVVTTKISGTVPPVSPLLPAKEFPGKSVFYNTEILNYAKEFMPDQDLSKLSAHDAADKLLANYKEMIDRFNKEVAQSGGGSAFEVDYDYVRKYYFDSVIAARVVHAREDSEWRKSLREAAKNWTRDEALAFVGRSGTWLVNNYDNSRSTPLFQPNPNPGGPDPRKGAVTPLQLIRGIETGVPAGVCRDIASFQAEMLQELGFKSVYVFSYNLHTTVVAQDPSNPRKIIKFNYDELTTAPDTLETRALRQSGDRSAAYEIFKPGGQLVSSIPSELGTILNEAAGGDIKEVDVFASSRTPVVGSVKLQNGSNAISVFTGRLSDGTTVMGAADAHGFGNPETEKHAVQVGGGVSALTNSVDTIDAVQAFGRIANYVNSPWYRAGEKLKARAETSTQLAIEGSTQTNRQNSVTGWMLENIGARAALEAGQTQVNIRGATQYAVGLKDVRDVSSVGLFHNLSYVSTDVERPIAGDWKAIGDLTLGVRQFGPQILASGGVRKGDSQIKAGYEGRLDGDVPSYAPGMSRKIFTEADTSLKGWKLSIEYREPVEGDRSAGRTFKAGATKTWKK